MTRRFKKSLSFGVALFLVYSALGFLAFPWLVRRIAVRELTKALGRTVAIKRIHFNPYALSITVQGFQVDELEGGAFLSWKTFYANFEPWASVFRRTWVFKEGVLDEPHVNVIRNTDGAFNVADLLLLNWPTIPQFNLSLMRLTNGRVTFHDAALPSAFSTTIGPLTGQFKDFSMHPDHKNSYSVSALSESDEKFTWEGSFRLNPLSSHGEIAAENVQIKKYYPYFEEFLAFSIMEGTVTARATYDLDLSRDHFKAIVSEGTLSAPSLTVHEHESERPLFGFSNLAMSGAVIDLVKQRIDIAGVVVTGGSAFVRRLPDKSFNIQHVIKDVSTPSKPKTPLPANWHVSAGDIYFNDFSTVITHLIGQNTLEWKELRISKPTFRMNPEVTSVAAITLQDGALMFSDDSVTPAVKMNLGHLNIQIGSVSSDELGGASVAVKAHINRDALLQVSGETNPIHKRARTNLRGLLQSVSLVPLRPYAEKYLGYELLKGDLNLDVKCLIQRQRLHIRSTLEIDQLMLGKKVESKDATKLPVQLAIALLKDTSGNITLNIPVEGTLDDPKFQIRDAIFEAVLTPFRKAVTAPFAALGSQMGSGGEELGFQDFLPGTTTLAPLETRKLDTILRALKRWPNLTLDIEGSVDVEKDRGNFHLLAANRAKTVMEYLVHQGSLEPNRVFLIDTSEDNVPSKGSRALLSLK